MAGGEGGMEVKGGIIKLRCIRQERFLMVSAFCNPPSLSGAARAITYNLHPRASISPWFPNPTAGGKRATGQDRPFHSGASDMGQETLSTPIEIGAMGAFAEWVFQ